MQEILDIGNIFVYLSPYGTSLPLGWTAGSTWTECPSQPWDPLPMYQGRPVVRRTGWWRWAEAPWRGACVPCVLYACCSRWRLWGRVSRYRRWRPTLRWWWYPCASPQSLQCGSHDIADRQRWRWYKDVRDVQATYYNFTIEIHIVKISVKVLCFCGNNCNAFPYFSGVTLTSSSDTTHTTMHSCVGTLRILNSLSEEARGGPSWESK